MTDVFAAGGLSRPKGYGLSARGSNDKPEMGPSVFSSGDRFLIAMTGRSHGFTG